MNYSNHSLRTNLQEWKNRLYRSTYQQLGHQLKFFFNNIDSNKQLSGLISEAISLFPYSKENLDQFTEQIQNGSEFQFKSDIDQTSFSYQVMKHLFQELNSYNLHQYTIFIARDFEATKSKIIEEYISPIIYYLHDRLDKSNSTIFLLEKYKKRTEWFTKKELTKCYKAADKSYEQIFEDDLRLFLFDQGIDYPFSTPSSASGRADIIGEIETDDPLIIEIKIFDREKGYGKERIKEGLTQVIKYANDYNKDVGYLVIFNMDNVEINFKTTEPNKVFPPALTFNNKTFYFVVVNCLASESASKSGTIKEIEITMEELTKK